MTIRGADIAGSDEFTLAESQPLPWRLEPGDVLPVTVRYTPAGSAESSAVLLITSNDPAEAEVPVTLHGNGSLAEILLEPAWRTFGSHLVGDTDTVTITVSSVGAEPLRIDGLSYQGDDGLLLDSAPALPLELLPGESLPLTVSFEPEDPGTFSGTLVVASSAGLLPEATASQTGEAALSLPLLEVEPASLNFSGIGIGCEAEREVTLRSIGNVPVTEPEQSGIAEDYVAEFETLAGGPSLLMMNDITGGEYGCSSSLGYADPGGGYLTATELTGGVSGLICDPDWGATIQDLALETGLLTSSFILAEEPVPVTVNVSVDMVPWTTGWTLAGTLLSFDDDSALEPGSLVQVDYVAAAECLP